MTHLEYIFQNLLPTWLRTWRYNFRIWADLITNNYEVYANPWCESPEKECYEWFWASINLDDTYPKEFLEDLERTIDLIDKEEVKLIPFKSKDLDYD